MSHQDPMPDAPVILWFRRDFRLSDLPMLQAAVETGRPVIPVFILDEVAEGFGAAPKWRLERALESFARSLGGLGSRLILRRGKALDVLRGLVAETGAADLWWTRLYDPDSVTRDIAVKAALKEDGIGARSYPGHVLFEPWTVETGQGGFYKVYTPYWRAVAGRDVMAPSAAPKSLRAPASWPASDRLEDWGLGRAMDRGAGIVAKHACVGEAAALDRLDNFLAERLERYKAQRDFPAVPATSRLSENLAWGEIAPARIWHAAKRAEENGTGDEHFRKELVWRDFAWHLIHHTPHIVTRNWRDEWDGFAWQGDGEAAERWRRGMTGEPFIDAAMREMYVTGHMHNRARMIVASYLTKHLLTDWRVGLRWFEECLIDWDPASNAMGWQWVAGSGPDAAPYFRIFNPATQVEKFDADARYRRAFIAEGQKAPPETALDYFRAVPRSWGLAPDQAYPRRMIDLAKGRQRALSAYEAHKS